MIPLGFRIRMAPTHARTPAVRRSLALGSLAAVLCLQTPAAAQQPGVRAGEAIVTQFPGTATVPGPGGGQISVLDPTGSVATAIDLRAPGRPPQGDHWIYKPRRSIATTGQTGLVFGIAVDTSSPPAVFLAATSAFGLHRTPDNADWLPGMWGLGGGPGTIYRVDPRTGQPVPFANITVNGRPNSGAALGNLAYDRWNRQLFVSDLETGLIHRIRVADGADLGFYDHGTQGRGNHTDAQTRQRRNLPPIPFNLASQAQIADCPSGQFQFSPECWNFAPNGRRVWGLGVGRVAASGEVRLYYSVASSPDLGDANWNNLSEEEKRHSVWSVRISQGGAFDIGDVRREFTMPDFFIDPADIARAGYSRPVSDIAFPSCTNRPVMLLAERGGVRNLGLDSDNAFATPHESRALRYELHQDGVWRPVGRYDVGSYQRLAEGTPRMFANCAGGAAFGYGYGNNWAYDQRQTDQYVWITGDALCSPNGPCNAPGAAPGSQPQAVSQQTSGDPSEVHGIQGVRENAFAELVPPGAYTPAQGAQTPIQSVGLDQSFLIDVDYLIDDSGAPVLEEFTRNDATRVGDIAVVEFCAAPTTGFVPLLAPPPIIIHEPGHSPSASHVRFASHSNDASHYRYGSHWPAMSHSRWGSHFPQGSYQHWPPGSYQHWPPGSVQHFPQGSVKHVPPGSIQHWPPGSKNHFPPGSIVHMPLGSVFVPPKHNPPGSVVHFPIGSKFIPPQHLPPGSKQHFPPGSLAHNNVISKLVQPQPPKHKPDGSIVHNNVISKIKPPQHFPVGSDQHWPAISKINPPKHEPKGSIVHNNVISKIAPPKHQPEGSVKHNDIISKISPPPKHQPEGSVKHNQALSKITQPPKHQPEGSIKHSDALSKITQPPKHQPEGSVKHNDALSKVVQPPKHQPEGSIKHSDALSKVVKPPKHQPEGSVHQPAGSLQHKPAVSNKLIQPKHEPPGSIQHQPAASNKLIQKPQHLPAGSVTDKKTIKQDDKQEPKVNIQQPSRFIQPKPPEPKPEVKPETKKDKDKDKDKQPSTFIRRN